MNEKWQHANLSSCPKLLDHCITWAASSFTPYGKPAVVTRSSSLGMSRTETIVYEDNTTKWILGQVKTVTEAGGKAMASNTYNGASANLESVSTFGHLDQTIGYYADGTVNTRKDGTNQTTTFSNYRRGVPQNVAYPNATSESAVVSNIGTIHQPAPGRPMAQAARRHCAKR